MVLYFGDPLKTHYNAAPLRQPFSNINSRLNQLRDVKIYSCWPGAHKWQRSADMKLFSGGTRSPNQGSSLRWQFWFFFHFITSVAVFSITGKKEWHLPFWACGRSSVVRWLSSGLGTAFRSNSLPPGLLIFWALICSSCSPFSSLMGPMHPRCIRLNGWTDSHLARSRGWEKAKVRSEEKKSQTEVKKAPLKMQTWMHSAFLTLL